MNQIWLQKHRPRTLDEVKGNIEQLNALKSCVNQGSIQHLILAGPPGVGKTSSVLCIVRQLLGDSVSQCVKELNASDERGIDVVRQQIKTFAHKKVKLPPGKTKIIILDQADSLTQGAQEALRMIISTYGNETRFVLSCNTSSKIIEPIQSRCIIIRFQKLTDSQITKNIQSIIIKQKVRITAQALKQLVFIADGDMRSAVNNLQACHYSSEGKQIDQNIVFHICDVPSTYSIKQCLMDAANSNISQALFHLRMIFKKGHSVYDIVSMFNKVLLNCEDDINREKLFEMMKFAALLKQRVLEGLSTEIQLASFLAQCASLK